MAIIDLNYKILLETILNKGYWYDDSKRKGIKRIEIPSYTFRHEFKDGFPAITTKKLSYKNVVTELIWFLRGDTNIKYLLDNGCNIWNKDAYNYFLKDKPTLIKARSIKDKEEILFEKNNKQHFDLFLGNVKQGNLGNLGPVYGHQWRNSNGIDQIDRLIKNLKEQPLATDHIVNSWNVGDLKDMALPPCHYGFQIVVRPLSVSEQDLFIKDDSPKGWTVNHNRAEYGFELHWHQRSVDTFLGLPYNIASYATLALMIEKITGYKALAIQGDLKKVHLYDNSINAVKEQLSKDVNKYDSCKLNYSDNFKNLDNCLTWGDINLDEFINSLDPGDILLENYESYPLIKVDMLERNEE